MSWRSEGWKTNKKTLDIPQGTEPQTTLCRHCAYMVAQAEYSYEKGADAMLESLKKMGGEVSAGEFNIPNNFTVVMPSNLITGTGILVFIPDQKQEGDV